MKRSVGEIRPEVTKAARGAGVPLGTVEDLAMAAPWLNAAALDDLAATLDHPDGVARLIALSQDLDVYLAGQGARAGAPARLWSALLASVSDTAPPPGPHEVPDALWARLAAYAARTYVPETDLSRRHGAGAGLLDND